MNLKAKSTKYVLYLSLFFLVLLFAGCGIGNESPQNFNGDDTTSLTINTKIAVTQLNNYSKKNVARSYTSLKRANPSEIDTVTVTITGSHFSYPIIYDLFEINGTWQGIIGDIPAGPVTITAEAFDNSDVKLYESITNVTLSNNETKMVNMTMTSSESAENFEAKAPLISGVNISPQKIAPGETVQLSVIADDPDSGSLSYIWTPQGDGNYDNQNIQSPTWTSPSTEGLFQLTVTVVDEEYLVDSYTVDIEVDDSYGKGNIGFAIGTNDYPEIYGIDANPTRINRNESTYVSLIASDPDGDTLSYSWTSSCGTFNNATVENPVFTSAPDAAYGLCSLIVDVSDGTLITTGSLGINISEEPVKNYSIEVLSKFQSTVTITSGENAVFAIEVIDPEGTPVTFTWNYNGGTPGTQTDTFTDPGYRSEFLWTAPSSGGPFIISVDVTDSDGLTRTIDFMDIALN